MAPARTRNDKEKPLSISSITVSGFKSIATEQSIDVRPLTLLAGANSSGKSSMMQAVLLLKQTLEATYDPGPLLLNGPNVRFTSTDQILSRGAATGETNELLIKIGAGPRANAEVVFGRESGKRLDVKQCTFNLPDEPPMVVTPDLSGDKVLEYCVSRYGELDVPGSHATVIRDRCFLNAFVEIQVGTQQAGFFASHAPALYGETLQRVLHLPGLRGNPERAYPLTATGPEFPGTFDKYTASVVAQWSHDSPERLEELGRDLNELGLTWKVQARELDDTRVELQVGRLRNARRGGAHDLVNIADVGFGVSQTLPVLVALLAARPGQLLYIEQPEIHLHPRAQVAMASLLAKAAMRGVHVVAETHSSLLLLGVQSQVAEGKLPAGLVKLHWFTRSETNGATTITSADLDEAGRFGDWPEDFDDVSLKAEARYLDAAEARVLRER